MHFSTMDISSIYQYYSPFHVEHLDNKYTIYTVRAVCVVTAVEWAIK